MKPRYSLSFLIFHFSFLFFLSSCSDKDDAPYPSVITELVDCPTDEGGTISHIVLDDDTTLPLTNPQSGLQASVTYRCMAGFTLDSGKATLYSLTGAFLLRDSTAVAQTDPTAVVSLWRTSRYLNLHLLPKTQGGEQSWGFITDSIAGRHAYLRLHHRQGEDPTAYSTDVYASLPLSLVDADTITLCIQTFNGTKSWEL